MAAIYLRHPVHGEKVACGDLEASMDRANGWVDFDPYENKVPSFLSGPVIPELPSDFPAREELISGGLSTWASLVGKTTEELQRIKGIGPSMAKRILDVMDS